MKNRNLLRADVMKGGVISVSENREIIMGVAVITKGVTHDERGEFDEDAINKVVELGNAAKFGIKSRYGHPNMSSTALGTFLGRFKSFRRDGDVVRADLYIDPSAHNTPDGDLAQYVISLARNDPDAFGTSVVIRAHFVDRSKETARDTEASMENEQAEDNSQFPLIVVEDLFACDVVDEPAANNAFFGKRFFTESVKLSSEMTEALDEFLSQPDGVEQAIAFLKRYQFNKKTTEKEVCDLVKSKAKMDVQFEAPIGINKFYVEKGVNEDPQSGQWIVEGLAATNDLDLQDEIISDEALTNSENDLLENSTVLFNHDINMAVGKVLKTERRDEGLWVQILISKTVPDIWQQIQEGVLNKFSIRGRVIDAVRKFVKEADKTVRVIKEMLLVEVSLVPLPANPQARAMGWFVQKALDRFESEGGEIPMTDQEKKKLEELEEAKKLQKDGEGEAAAPEGEAAAPEGEAKPEGEAQPEGEAKPEGEAQPEGEAEKTFTQAELDEAVSKAVEEAVAKKDAESKDEVSKLSQTVKDLQDRLDESEADSAVEKMWNEKYSSMYKEEDASEIKQLLKKMKLNQALTPEEMNVMIDKKETQEEILPSSSETIVSKGISEERKEELRRLGGIKTAAK
jgi:HK97 family phage prohead protease